MHRSSSTTRVADDYFKGSSSSWSPVGSGGAASHISLDSGDGDGVGGGGGTGGGGGGDLIPIYSPSSHPAKKERPRSLRSAENAVHLIPLVLIVCAIILWLFSNPVDLIRRGDLEVAATAEGLKATRTLGVDGTQHNSLTTHFDELEDVALAISSSSTIKKIKKRPTR